MKSSQKRLRILHLARWYPNRFDPMPGLFIQRHAEAVALYADTMLVYTHAVEKSMLRNKFEIDFEEKNGVTTAKVYFQNPGHSIPVWSHFQKIFRFLKANSLGIKAVSDKGNSFDVIHVHVLTRLGLLVLYFKWAKKIPFVITEHWTRYLNLTNGFNGLFRKWLTRWVVKEAAVVTTVSEDLSRAMQSHGLKNPDYRVIANVVDDVFFQIQIPERNTKMKEFVHVSCFTDKHKNISGLLRVINNLAKQRQDFHFTLVGEGEDLEKMKNYAQTLGIPKQLLTFTGLLEGKALAETMANAHALVIFSNYENMPVVINESFVLGVPVFSTRVGGIAEMVNEANGCLVDKGDEAALLKVMIDFLAERITFKTKAFREQARKAFSPQAVGLSLMNIYKNVLKQ
jgi:glycosyltransferase involved in cell wall biosynthesis